AALQRLAVDGEREDRRVRRVALAVRRRRGERARQERRGRVDRRLHVLLGRVDVAIERELERDLRAPEARDRRHLLERRHLPELPLERRRDRRGHRLGAGAGQIRGNYNRRILDLRQRRDRELAKREQADEQEAEREER